jgi:hypothetical protein
MKVTPFEGKWETAKVSTKLEINNEKFYSYFATLVFKNDTFLMYNNIDSNKFGGHFDYDEEKLVFTFKVFPDSIWTKSYILIEDTLILDKGTGGLSGSFIKLID